MNENSVPFEQSETFYFAKEADAHKAQQRWIQAGYEVSLVGFDGTAYVFDVFNTKGRN